MLATWNSDVTQITLAHKVIVETILADVYVEVFPTSADAEARWNEMVAKAIADEADFAAHYVEPAEMTGTDWETNVLNRTL